MEQGHDNLKQILTDEAIRVLLEQLAERGLMKVGELLKRINRLARRRELPSNIAASLSNILGQRNDSVVVSLKQYKGFLFLVTNDNAPEVVEDVGKGILILSREVAPLASLFQASPEYQRLACFFTQTRSRLVNGGNAFSARSVLEKLKTHMEKNFGQ